MCWVTDVTTKCHSCSYHMSCTGFYITSRICVCALWLITDMQVAQAFIFTAYFGNCLVCLGGCAWCACGRDCLGIPLRPDLPGERRILRLRKATELHLWSDRGMKCHKQLLHRQPAVTTAVKPVGLRQQRHTLKNRVCLSSSCPVFYAKSPNPQSSIVVIVQKRSCKFL